MLDEKQKHSIYIWLLVSLAISVIIQLASFSFIKNPIDQFDSKEYLSISGSLFKGKGYGITDASFEGFESFKGETPTRMRQPGYPFYLVLFYWLLGENVLAVQLSQVILNILSFYFIFLIAYKTFQQSLWPGTLIGLGLYFPVWLTSAYVLTESLFIFLLVLFMFLFQRAIYSKKIIYFVLSGAVLGSAFLTRPIALPLCLLSFFVIWFYVKSRKAIVYYVVLLIAFLAVLSPWFLRNVIVLGDYTPLSTDGGYNLWYANREGNDSKWFSSPEFKVAVQDGYYIDREANSRFTRMAITHIKADPIGFFKRGLLRVAWTWSYFPGSRLYRDNGLVFSLFSLLQFAILAFTVLGLLKIDKVRVAYFLLPAVSFSFVLVFTYTTSRFIVPAMPFLLIASGEGFCFLFRCLFRHATLSSQGG